MDLDFNWDILGLDSDLLRHLYSRSSVEHQTDNPWSAIVLGVLPEMDYVFYQHSNGSFYSATSRLNFVRPSLQNLALYFPRLSILPLTYPILEIMIPDPERLHEYDFGISLIFPNVGKACAKDCLSTAFFQFATMLVESRTLRPAEKDGFWNSAVSINLPS
jgi:hypothetical protein